MTQPARRHGELEPALPVEETAGIERDALPAPPEAQSIDLSEGSEPLARPADAPIEGEDARSPKPKAFQSLLDLLHDLAIAVVVCILLITYVVQAFKVQGTSMAPELHDSERILVNKLVYHFGDIDRGDVVVFWYPEDPDLSFIKRVVGLPGERVEIRGGTVYVDGRRLDEPYVDARNADRRSLPPLTVRPGHYFVLGDNRKGSNDSRSWGLVPERYVYGRAVLVIWPPANLGLVD